MKGFIKQFATVSCFAAALFTLIGCSHYRNVVDPCWPERYNYLARQSVRDMHNAQADRGHALEQTIWNSHFVSDAKTHEGTDKLNEAGKEKLRQIARRQPHPDFQLWLQYPHDVKDAGRRDGLIEMRKAAIRDYLTNHTKLAGGGNYQIGVHDEVQPVYQAEWTERAIKNMERNIQSGQPQIFVEPSTGGSSGGSGGGR